MSWCLTKNCTMERRWVNFIPWSLYPQEMRPQYPLDTHLDMLHSDVDAEELENFCPK